MQLENRFLALPDERLAALGITTAEVIGAIERAVAAKAAGRLWTTPKSALLPGDGRYMMTTLSAADEPPLIAVKAVMVSPRNAGRGLPGVNGAILLLDSETGMLVATLGANWVTAVRTAGLSAVVARRLADPRSRSVAFIGSGTQARSHLEAFAELFPLREVRVFGRGRANSEALCAAARAKGLAARMATNPQDALEGSDLVVSSVTLNYDLEPFLDARWLKPGAFAAITDLGQPWQPASLPAFATIVIDDLEQEAAMPKPLAPPALVAGDLVGLVSGRIAAAFDPSRRAAFLFRGIALGDFAVATLAYARATGG
jgi:ornithine cyclodeaminase/alanine dehydrogenase-like protein (mu-crystallin family)